MPALATAGLALHDSYALGLVLLALVVPAALLLDVLSAGRRREPATV